VSVQCVVDASVGVKLFVSEPQSGKASELFALLAAAEAAIFHVPDAFYYEVVATLRKYALTTGYSHLKRDTTRLTALRLNVTPTIDLLIGAVDISLSQMLSTYDALYMALAQQLKAPLITADDRLVHAMHGKPFDVRSLAALDLSSL
jgi:predicted nucleic acid-binding protein